MLFSNTLVHDMMKHIDFLSTNPCIAVFSIHGYTRLYTVLGEIVFVFEGLVGIFFAYLCNFCFVLFGDVGEVVYICTLLVQALFQNTFNLKTVWKIQTQTTRVKCVTRM